MNTLWIVFKTADRCNINCSYCYYYHQPISTKRKYPKFFNLSNIESVNTLILDAVKNHDINHVTIGLHGGEPMLMKQEHLKTIIDSIDSNFDNIKKINPKITYGIGMQTNGTLIDVEWANFIRNEKISIGISLDGNQENHDLNRVDFNGNGTYRSVTNGIKNLTELNYPLGLLSVINPASDARLVHSELISFNPEEIHYLLPDSDITPVDPSAVNAIADWLIAIFKIEMEARAVNRTRFVSKTLRAMLVKEKSKPDINTAITIDTNGDVHLIDEFRNILSKDNFHIGHIDMIDFQKVKNHIDTIDKKYKLSELPIDCQNCKWATVCQGGNLISSPLNRFHNDSFNNKSNYCVPIYQYLDYVHSCLVNSGHLQA